MEISRSAIRDYYVENRVSYTQPSYKYADKRTPAQHLKEKTVWVLRTVKELMLNRTLIYFDETTCNMWQRRSRIW